MASVILIYASRASTYLPTMPTVRTLGVDDVVDDDDFDDATAGNDNGVD